MVTPDHFLFPPFKSSPYTAKNTLKTKNKDTLLGILILLVAGVRIWKTFSSLVISLLETIAD